MNRNRFATLRYVLLTFLVISTLAAGLFANPQLVFAAATPVALLDVPAEQFIGEDVEFIVSFDNAGTDTGYGPYIDLFLPAGADGSTADPRDGLQFVSAKYLSSPVRPVVAPFVCAGTGSGPGLGTFTHPLTGLATDCPLRSQVVILQPPFGSFTAGQPPADISVSTTMSNLADLGTPLDIQAQAGFFLGETPTNDPATDPPLVQPGPTTASVTPILIEFKKEYVGPEDETATGPNFPRQYRVIVDIAEGQTITNLALTDVLPDTMQFLSLDSVTTVNPAAPTVTDVAQPSTTTPGGTLTQRIATVTGTAGAEDAVMTFSFYVPHVDSSAALVLDAATGDDRVEENQASALGDWTPIDTRDAGSTGNVVANPVGPEHELEDQSIAIQKGLSTFDDGKAAGYTPGDVLEYALDFQVSDFFAFDTVVITDTIGDGLRLDPTFTPTLEFQGQDGDVLAVANINTANYTVSENFTGAAGTPNPPYELDPATNDGSTRLIFRVSDELVTRGAANGGQLIGGCVPNSGTTATPPYCTDTATTTVNDGPTQGRIVYRLIIQDQFTDDFPSGDASVDQGDLLRNEAVINGQVLDNSDLSPTGNFEDDDTAEEIEIARGDLSKSVYAVNGDLACPPTNDCTNVIIQRGDTVTYRIQLTLPSSDVEDLQLIDFLPLPIFDVDDTGTTISPTFGTIADATAPAAGTAKLGPNDTFYTKYATAGGTLVITNEPISSGGPNSVTFDFGDYDDPNNDPSQIDLLFTVTASSDPFDDRLLLTNQVRQKEAATNNTPEVIDRIVQILMTEPDTDTIIKGVIAVDANSNAVVPAGALPAGVTFNPAAACAARFSGGPVTSATLPGTFDSNLAGADAGDIVSFAIVVQNIGSGPSGTFDVKVRDVLPTGLTLVAGSVCANDGTGAAFTTTGDLFTVGGLELTDPGPTATPAGALDPGKEQVSGAQINNGRNIAIITYNATVANSVGPNATLTNTATLFNYANREGGPDFTLVDPSDPATVTTGVPTVVKSLVTTSEAHTLDTSNPPRVTIGEIVRYRLAARITEGTTPDFQIEDRLPGGLTFLNDGTARFAIVSDNGITSSGTNSIAGGQVTGSTVVTPTTTLPDPNVSKSATANDDTYGTGDDIRFKFGDLTNTDNDANLEYVVVEFNALVDNSNSGARNDAGDDRNNSARLYAGGSQIGVDSADLRVRIAEPLLSVTKSVSPDQGDIGDTVTYSIVVLNASGVNVSDAFDTVLTDTVPSELTLLPATLTITPTGGTTGESVNATGNDIAANATQIPSGGGFEITYQATINSGVLAGEAINNTTGLLYTSLPGPNGTIGNPTGSNNTGASGSLTGERNGSSGANAEPNDYANNDTATLTVFIPQPVKSLVATSEPHTAGNDVAIGEIVRYRLVVSVGESSIPGFAMVDELPDGLRFLNDGSAKFAFLSNSGGISSNDTGIDSCVDIDAQPGTLTSSQVSCLIPAANITNNGASGGDVTFAFGDLLNDDTDADQEYVVVEFNALVDNGTSPTENDNGDTRANTFFARYNGNDTPDSAPVTVTVREPVIANVTKTVTTTPTDAGDTVSYQVTFSNSGSTTAFDVSLLDTLPTGLTLDTGSVNVTPTGTVTGIDSTGTAGNTVDVQIASMDAGSSLNVTYSATVDAAAVAGATLTNTATVNYTSLPGSGTPTGANNATGSATPGASGDADGERDSSGGATPPNDYTDNSVASVTLATPTIDKLTPTPTSYTIGNTVTYTIAVTLPEGETQGLVVTDNLPDGLVVTGYTIDTSSFAGTLGTTTSTPATFPGTSGQDLVVTFPATVTATNDNNTANNTFTILVSARVANIVANANGVTLSNTASLSYTNGTTGNLTTVNDPTPPAAITLTEPQITTTKTVNPTSGVQAGDTVTYTVTLTNTGTSTAFDAVLDDTLPAGVGSPTLVSVTLNGSDITASSALTGTAPNITIQGTGGAWDIPVGQSIVVVYSVVAESNLTLASSLTNSADADWSSVDGDNPNERVYDDTTTRNPGSSQDGVQDRAGATFTTPAPSFSKSDGGTTDVVIGQVVDYTLTLTSPLGTLRDLVITDTLPAGMVYVTGSASVGSGISPTPTPTVSTPNDGSASVTLVWNFGDAEVSSSPVTISYQARVANVASNQVGTTLSNNAELSYSDDTGAQTLTDTDDVTVQEPALDISKVVDPQSADLGTLLTYTITVTNTGAATAHDVVVTDVIPTGTTYELGSVSITSNPTSSTGTTDDSDTSELRWEFAAIGAGETATLTFQARITDANAVGMGITNTAATTWTSLAGVDANERDGSDGEGGALNDYAASGTAEILPASYTLTKELTSPTTETAGVNDEVTFTITITNVGTVPIATLPFSDTFDSAILEFQSATINGTASTPDSTTPAGTITWNDLTGGGSLAPNTTLTLVTTFKALTYTTETLPPTAETTNTAQVNGATDTNNNPLRPLDDSATVAIGVPDLAISKTDGESTSEAGDVLTYSILVRNNGSFEASSVTITETIPVSTTFVGGNVTWNDAGSGVYTYTLPTALAAGANETLEITVQLANPFPRSIASITNNVSVADDGSHGPEPDTSDNSDSDTDDVVVGSLGNRVWRDNDGDGTQDAGEPGISGLTVTLTYFGPDGVLGGGDDVTYTTTTGANGIYGFDGLPSGNFQVDVAPPIGATATYDLDDQGGTVTTPNTTLVSLTTGQNRLDVDFGYNTLGSGTGSIGDRFWLDSNSNGRQDPGEPGINGVTVSLLTPGADGLFGTADDVVETTDTTTGNGNYSFDNLPAGDYRVVVDSSSLPGDLRETYELDRTLNGSTSVSLDDGENRTDVDFGYASTSPNAGTLGSIGDRVWDDTNANGVQDPGETGLNGVTVTLTGAGPDGVLGTADDTTATTTTDRDGDYVFTNLPAGKYTVSIDPTTLPGGVTETYDLDGGNDNTTNVTLGVGQNRDNVDFGYTDDPAYTPPTGSIGDTIWLDLDGNGTRDAGEPGIKNVDVTLVYYGADGVPGGGDDVTYTTTTDDNGNYSFPNLPEGNFVVTVDTSTLPGGVTPTFDFNGGNDNTTAVTLTDGETNNDIDFGYAGTGSLGDRVWNDTNANGVQDAGETGVNGVTVTLTGAGPDGQFGTADDTTATTTTSGDGNYSFANLPADKYRVAVSGTPLDSLNETYELDGTRDGSTTVTLNAGQNRDNVDFGYTDNAAYTPPTGSIGNTVWLDLDGNGVRGPGETGIGGVDITLVYYGADGVPGGGDDVTYTTTTDDNGNYTFPNLPEGKFLVTVDSSTLPAGVTETYERDGTLNGSTNVSLGNGQNRTDINFGYKNKPNTATVGSIGDRVWNDGNANGVQDPGETGLNGVTVTLTGAGPDGLFGTTDDTTETRITSGDGNYSFANLPAGKYRVDVDTGTLPGGATNETYELDGTRDSSVSVVLGVGENRKNVDFGYTADTTYTPPTGSIGDTIWLDLDGDGVQNPGEPGISNVDVTLVYYGADGVPGGGDDVTYTTTTDDNGNYNFPNLPDGAFAVTVDTSTLPGGVTPTFDLDGGNDNTTVVTVSGGQPNNDADFGYAGTGSLGDRVWNDANGNRIQDPSETGFNNVTVTLTGAGPDGVFGTADDFTKTTTTNNNGNYSFNILPAGKYKVDVDTSALPAGVAETYELDGTLNSSTTVALGAGQDREDVDFGYTTNPAYVPPTGRIGDQLWLDLNGNGVKDAGEPGLAGVTVDLVAAGADGTFGTSDDVVYIQETDTNGNYNFTDLPAGNYKVNVDTGTLPAGVTVTTDRDGTADNTTTVALGDGAVIDNADFGYQGAGSIGSLIWYDFDNDGVQDPNEPGFGGVIVTATWYGPDGVPGGGDDLTFTTTTDANGNYSFNNVPLGNYEVTVSSGLPGGTEQSYDLDSRLDGVTQISLTPTTPTKIDVNFGYIGTASLGDYVWYDINGDGVQNGGETGFGQVDVTLIWAGADGQIGTADDLTKTVQTDPTGFYEFTGLVAGEYVVEVTPVAGYVFSQQGRGGDGAMDSNVNITTGRTDTITLGDGERNDTIDAALTLPASLGNVVWVDENENGVRDPNEPGLGGVEVNLYDGQGNLVATTTTNPDGSYEFTNLTPGDYQIEFIKPDGYEFTVANNGDDAIDSDVDATTGRTPIITLGPGQSDQSWFAGLFKPKAPTAITLVRFTAARQGDSIAVNWETGVEIDTLGFHVLRSTTGQLDDAVQVTSELILRQGLGRNGASYSWVDNDVEPGTTYTYWLEETEINGSTAVYGPATVLAQTVQTSQMNVYLPMLER